MTKTFPAIFLGHGSPMLALEDNAVAHGLRQIGQEVLDTFGKPKAILMISAHWYKGRTLVQSAEEPRQVYEMRGFPKELYEVKYEPKGSKDLTDAILAIEGLGAHVDDSWGIDHGTWSTLIHAFPEADIPVVQLSVNGLIGPQACYELGKLLRPLRDQGYLLMASGNVVHNLRLANFHSQQGSPEAVAFNEAIITAIEQRDDQTVIDYERLEHAHYAVPTPDHYLPLLYILGASQGEKPRVFNNIYDLNTMVMTGFAFGM